MKERNITIIGPHISKSKGGMASSLSAFYDELRKKEYKNKVYYIASHEDEGIILKLWLSAFYKIVLSLISNKSSVYWFHMGPWLSIIRKSSLAFITRLFRKETIGHFHSLSLDNYLSTPIGRLFIKVMVLPYTKIIVLTPWWKLKLEETIKNKPIYVIANPIKASLVIKAKELLKQPTVATEVTTVFSMTRLIKGKGIEETILAFASLPDNFCLLIAGEGSDKNYLERIVSELNLSHKIRFLGWLDEEQKMNFLHKSDIFCLPSKNDSFGMVFLEAMLLNKPIVACGYGPLKDIVKEHLGICLSDRYCVAELTNAIITLNENLDIYKGKGLTEIKKYYIAENLAQKFLNILKS
jgi:glycosyltransferase involved in cell wall biosynthesis